MPISDTEAKIADLVQKAQSGNVEAYGKIYDHYFSSVYRYVSMRVPTEVSEDLVAEIFVKAWEKLHTYSPKRKVPFGAWLFRIAKNAVVDTYRTTKTWDEVPEDMGDSDELNRADTAMHKALLAKTVKKAMNQLPGRYREVLSLSFMADLPADEVARVLHVSSGSVRVLKLRALRKLESLLPQDLRENL